MKLKFGYLKPLDMVFKAFYYVGLSDFMKRNLKYECPYMQSYFKWNCEFDPVFMLSLNLLVLSLKELMLWLNKIACNERETASLFSS